MSTTSSETSPRLSRGANQVAVAGWGLVAALFVALGFAAQASGGTDPNLFYRYSTAANVVGVYAILLAVTVGIAAALGRPLRAVGVRSFSWGWLWRALGLIGLVLALSAALEPLLHAGKEQGLAPEVWQPNRAGAFALNAVVASTVVPLAEELFFRGLGVRALLPFGGLAAVTITALAFGLGHGVLVALPVLVPFGLVLGWVRWRSDSVWPGVIAHGSYNGAALFVLYLTLT